MVHKQTPKKGNGSIFTILGTECPPLLIVHTFVSIPSSASARNSNLYHFIKCVTFHLYNNSTLLDFITPTEALTQNDSTGKSCTQVFAAHFVLNYIFILQPKKPPKINLLCYIGLGYE